MLIGVNHESSRLHTLCGHHFETEKAKGELIRCPKCNKVNEVPKPEPVRPAKKPVHNEVGVSSPTSPERTSEKKNWRGI